MHQSQVLLLPLLAPVLALVVAAVALAMIVPIQRLVFVFQCADVMLCVLALVRMVRGPA